MPTFSGYCCAQGTEVVGECAPFERVVVLDGNWRKARAMLSHPKLRGLRKVQLPLDVRTFFWCASDTWIHLMFLSFQSPSLPFCGLHDVGNLLIFRHID
jgi:hypothetical protein